MVKHKTIKFILEKGTLISDIIAFQAVISLAL